MLLFIFLTQNIPTQSLLAFHPHRSGSFLLLQRRYLAKQDNSLELCYIPKTKPKKPVSGSVFLMESEAPAASRGWNLSLNQYLWARIMWFFLYLLIFIYIKNVFSELSHIAKRKESMNRLLRVLASYIMHMALLSVENIVFLAEYIWEVRALRLFWQQRGFRVTSPV